MENLKKARNGLKECWKAVSHLIRVIPNSEALKDIKLALKDIEYGYGDEIKKQKEIINHLSEELNDYE